MRQASLPDGFAFNPFSFRRDGLSASEVDIGWREIAEALVISAVV